MGTVSKFIAIYDGQSNANPEMTCPELFASQIQWPTLEEVKKKRAGTGRVIAILEMVYSHDLLGFRDGLLIDVKLHQN